jgi:Leucine-rich repeat (LRR) protein
MSKIYKNDKNSESETLSSDAGLKIALARIEEYKNNTKKRTLNLKNLRLTTIPDEVFRLSELRELVISLNPISHIPLDLIKLYQLKNIHASHCQFTEFPEVFLRMPQLERVNLNNNKIEVLPNTINVLTSLQSLLLGGNVISELPDSITHIASLVELNLTSNKLKSLPKNMLNLINLKNILLFKNPIKYFPQITHGGGSKYSAVEFLLRYYLNLSSIQQRNTSQRFENHINFDKDIKVAFYQYLLYFNIYIEKSKGKRLDLRVEEDDTGLIISGHLKDRSFIVTYLKEYVGFIKGKVEKIEPVFEKDVSSTEKELTMIELRNQIRHLQSQLELKNLESKMLNSEVKRLMEIITIDKHNPQPIYIQASSQAYSSASATANLDMKVELPDFQNLFLELKNELFKVLGEAQRRELETIDAELLAIDDNVNPDEISKSPFRRLKRIFDHLNNPESEWSNAIKGSKKAIEFLQSLGKKYNKFAPWLAIPSIPDILLGNNSV